MKKSEPKMILNLSLENEEFEKKIEIAMDEYLDKITQKELDEFIQKVVTKRIDELISPKYSWSNDAKISGVGFKEFIKQRTEKVIADTIDANIKDILGKRIAAAIMKGLNNE